MGHTGGAGVVRGGAPVSREEPSERLKPIGALERMKGGRDDDQLDRIMADLDAAISGLDDVVRQAAVPRTNY